MKNWLLSFLFLLLTLIVKSQNYPQWYCMSHDEIIWDLAFDHDIVWIATRGGLVKHDRITGANDYYNSANSPLYQNEIKDVEVDTGGAVWIGGYYGDLTKFDGTNWTHYWSFNGVDSIQGIREMHKDRNGKIYISPTAYYNQGLFRLDGTNFTNLNAPEPYIQTFDIDTSNNIWCTGNNKIYKYDGVSWSYFDTTNSSLPYGIPQSICADKKNNIWVSMYEMAQPHNKKIYCFDGTNWNYIPPALSGISLNDYPRMIVDDSSNVYFFGNSTEIKKFDGINYSSIPLSTFGISTNGVYNFKVDSAFHYWIMPAMYGDTVLYEYDGSNTIGHFASNSPLRSANVNALAIDHDGNRWFGHDYMGVQKFDGFTWTNYDHFNSNINLYNAGSIFPDNSGNIWIGSESDSASVPQIRKFDGTNWTYFFLPSSFGCCGWVKKITEDKFNNIWLHVYGQGVAKYDGTAWTYFDSASVGTGAFFSMDLAIDTNNSVWVSDWGKGLLKYDNNVWTVFNQANSAIPSNYIGSVFADRDNNIWITANDSGLIKFDGDTTFTIYGAYNSLVQGFPYCVTQDSSGSMWISTNSGITKFDGLTWTHFDKYNSGLGELDIASILIDKNNTKWIDGFNGLWVFNENGIAPSYWFNVPETKFQGKIYYDTNNNGTCDSLTEPGLTSQRIFCSTDSTTSYTNTQGNYAFYKDPGAYQSAYVPYANWNITSDSTSYSVLIDSVSLSGFDYGSYPANSFNSVDIDIIAGSNRCNASFPLWISYVNSGTSVSAGTITFIKHDSLQFSGSIPAASSINGDTITWNYSSLIPFETRNIIIQAKNPGVNSINDTLTSFIIINDSSGVSSSDSIRQVIRCSYDPNEKDVSPIGITPGHLVLFGDSLEYTIHFQNLGNDTAFSVYIIDTIAAAMQMNSFEFINSSHPVVTEVLKNGVMRFRFDSIMLPPKNINESASIGYVRYRLSPQQNMQEFTTVNNTAYIYFDFNPAVVTNTVFNTYVSAFTGIHQTIKDESVYIYPNPFHDQLKIELEKTGNPMSVISLSDITGREILKYRSIDTSVNLNTAFLKPGVYIAEIENGNKITRTRIVKY